MKLKVYNHKDIKLQGISYYLDCYKFWDLNKCEQDFESESYYQILESIPNRRTRLYNGRGTMAVIDLESYKKNYQNYYDSLSKNVIRDIKTSEKNKFYFKKFDFNTHIQDFSEINFSQEKIKNEKNYNVNPWYLKPVEYFKGSHSGYRHKWEDDLHFSQWYGLFKYYKNYKQADVITNEKLFGYCKLLVDGEMASIGLVWSHANHLKKGIMFHLITSIVDECMKNENIKYLVYYGWGQYPDWKKRMLFEPKTLKIIL